MMTCCSGNKVQTQKFPASWRNSDSSTCRCKVEGKLNNLSRPYYLFFLGLWTSICNYYFSSSRRITQNITRAVLFVTALVMSDGQLSDNTAARVRANCFVCPLQWWLVTMARPRKNSTCSPTFELHIIDVTLCLEVKGGAEFNANDDIDNSWQCNIYLVFSFKKEGKQRRLRNGSGAT